MKSSTPVANDGPGPGRERPRLRLVEWPPATTPAPVPEAFVMLPLRVLRNGGLSPWARLVYALLVHYDRLPNGAVPGRDRMAADLGTSTDTIDRALAELVDAQLIERRRRGRGRTNAYTLCGTPDDAAPVPTQDPHDAAPVRTHADDAAPLRTLDAAPVPTLESAPVRHKQEGVNQEGEKTEKTSSSQRARRQLHPLSAEWTVSDRLVAYGETHGFVGADFATQVEKFRNHAAATGRRCKDWDAAFRNWILVEVERRKEQQHRKGTKPVLDVSADPFAGYRGGAK